jgi:Na+-translocating ferredoxin:NAD+ oxidoreductase RnfE subunit
MSTTTGSTTSPTGTRTGLSLKNTIGLGLCGLLGLADMTSIALIGRQNPDEPGPPAAVLVFAAVMGVVTVLAVIYTWRTRGRIGARIVAGSRVLSALTALPAFFVDDVSPGLVVGAGAGVLVTLVAIWLVLSGNDREGASWSQRTTDA